MRRVSILLVGIILLGATVLLGWRLLRMGLRTEVYRARLEAVSADLASLRTRYNEVVRRTAVTQLAVSGGRLRVSVRGADGELETIDTPFDPEKEIYVDYVVIDGRLWIRRVFDEDTPPGRAVQIDPALVDIDWSEEDARYGKAAYRPLDEGNWIVTVTGDGSLGLRRQSSDELVPLSPPPPVRDYAPLEQAVDAASKELDAREILQALSRFAFPQ